MDGSCPCSSCPVLINKSFAHISLHNGKESLRHRAILFQTIDFFVLTWKYYRFWLLLAKARFFGSIFFAKWTLLDESRKGVRCKVVSSHLEVLPVLATLGKTTCFLEVLCSASLLQIGFTVRFMLRFGSVRVSPTVRTYYGSCRLGSCGSIRFTGILQYLWNPMMPE